MTTQDMLLRDILENPEDDTPRLIYADWLEDTGVDYKIGRAGIIRSQIRREPLRFHQERWFDKLYWVSWGWQWLWQLPSSADYSWELLEGHTVCTSLRGVDLYWNRGFVNCVNILSDLFMMRCQNMFSAHPITRVIPLRLPATSYGSLEAYVPSLLGGYLWFPVRSYPTIADPVCGCLPDAVFDLLSGGDLVTASTYSYRRYGTSEDARQSASRAFVAYGRRQAHLTWGSAYEHRINTIP